MTTDILLLIGGLVLLAYVLHYPNPFHRDRRGRLPWHEGYEGDRGPR